MHTSSHLHLMPPVNVRPTKWWLQRWNHRSLTHRH